MTEKEKMKEWLDNLIALHRVYYKLSHEYKKDGVEAISVTELHRIHVIGLEHVAHVLGLTLNFNPNFSSKYPDTGEVTAEYNGVRLHCLWKKGE